VLSDLRRSPIVAVLLMKPDTAQSFFVTHVKYAVVALRPAERLMVEIVVFIGLRDAFVPAA